jgi:hypothetical protein
VIDDDWKTHTTHEAAKATGEWLEGRRGRPERIID